MLKILVPVKRVPDPVTRLSLDPVNMQPALAGVRMVLNPYDEVALEAAVQFKESGHATEVIALCAGNAACDETLRTALALGADRAIRVQETASPLALAHAIAAMARQEEVDLIIFGARASDSEGGHSAAMAAALLNWAFAGKVSALGWQTGAYPLIAESEASQSTEELSLPAVISADLDLNKPRFAKLPAIVAAKRKNIAIIDLSLPAAPETVLQNTTLPPPRPAGQTLGSIEELVDIILQKTTGPS